MVLFLFALGDILVWRLNNPLDNFYTHYTPAFFIALFVFLWVLGAFVFVFVFEKIFKWEIKSNTLTKNLLYKIFITIGMIIFLIYTIGISVAFVQSFFS